MKTEKRIVRLEPFGPAKTGMQKMHLEPEDFQSEIPMQHIHVYYEDETLGLSVGVVGHNLHAGGIRTLSRR